MIETTGTVYWHCVTLTCTSLCFRSSRPSLATKSSWTRTWSTAKFDASTLPAKIRRNWTCAATLHLAFWHFSSTRTPVCFAVYNACMVLAFIWISPFKWIEMINVNMSKCSTLVNCNIWFLNCYICCSFQVLRGTFWTTFTQCSEGAGWGIHQGQETCAGLDNTNLGNGLQYVVCLDSVGFIFFGWSWLFGSSITECTSGFSPFIKKVACVIDFFHVIWFH